MQFLILVYVNFAFQHDPLPQQPKSEQLEKLKVFKVMLERLITFLQVSKNNITPNFKEKLGFYEKQIVGFLNPSRYRKPIPNLQLGQPPQPRIQPMQQPQSQVPQLQSHENQLIPQLQSMNTQGSVPQMLQTQQLKRLQQRQNLMQNQQMQQQQQLHQQAPSPMPGDSDKPVSGISSLLNTGNIVHQPSVAQALAPSLAIGTSGISASPLLAEFTSPDGAHGGALTTVSGKSNVTEQPLECLIKAVSDALLLVLLHPTLILEVSEKERNFFVNEMVML